VRTKPLTVLAAYIAGYWTCTLVSTISTTNHSSSPLFSMQDFQQESVSQNSNILATIEQNDPPPQEDSPPNRKKKPADPNWYRKHIPSLTRTWNTQSPERWCVREEDPPTPWTLQRGDDTAQGLLYIKSYKTGSSTCEGIAWNIAHHVGKRLFSGQHTCRAYSRHEFANLRHHARKDPHHALLWSFVRHPAKRDLSHVNHFLIGREGRTFDAETTVGIPQYIEGKVKGRQTRLLVPKKTSAAPLWPRHELRKDRKQVIQLLNETVMWNYDFLGVTERMDESLAVMVLLWQLKPEDVIVLDSKRSGGYDDGGYNDTCKVIPKVEMTPILEEYVVNRHPIWNADYLLYYAANASLDRTIDGLGRQPVEDMVRRIRSMRQMAEKECLAEAVFPCSADGVFQPIKAEKSCYVQDAGCGHACIDRVLVDPLSMS